MAKPDSNSEIDKIEENRQVQIGDVTTTVKSHTSSTPSNIHTKTISLRFSHQTIAHNIPLYVTGLTHLRVSSKALEKRIELGQYLVTKIVELLLHTVEVSTTV